MIEPSVKYEFDADTACAIITLNRPEKRNALNNEVIGRTFEYAERAQHDDNVRSVVLTGTGDRVFSAGADLAELGRRDHISEIGPVSGRRRELTFVLENMPKPTIAALNGHAVGGGLELALACTFRIAAPHIKLGLPEVGLGIMPGNGGTQRLARLIGMGRALEMVLTGTLFEAEQAEHIGLVNKIVRKGSVLDEARTWAALFATKPPRALAAAKEALLISNDLPLAAGLGYENKWFAILCGAPEKTAALEEFENNSKQGAKFD